MTRRRRSSTAAFRAPPLSVSSATVAGVRNAVELRERAGTLVIARTDRYRQDSLDSRVPQAVTDRNGRCATVKDRDALTPLGCSTARARSDVRRADPGL